MDHTLSTSKPRPETLTSPFADSPWQRRVEWLAGAFAVLAWGTALVVLVSIALGGPR